MQKYFATTADSSLLITRRNMLTLTGTLAAGLALAAMIPGGKAFGATPAGVRTLLLNNVHTGDKCQITYWENGKYVPDALAEINHVLRDYRTGDVKAMDPNLLNTLAQLHRTLGSKEPFQVVSGYRSPKTNAMLHAQSEGVAKHSMHMEGKATDIRLGDRSIQDIKRAALMLGHGGVGYYAKSDFVHVDTGRVRQWVG